MAKLENKNESAACFPDLVNNRINASQCVKNGTYGTPDGFCTDYGINEVCQANLSSYFVDGIC